jgi:hypothetical protein
MRRACGRSVPGRRRLGQGRLGHRHRDSYGQAVKFNAVVDTLEPPVSTLAVYAQSAGGAKTKVASFIASGNWNVAGTEHFDRSTTIYAVYSGNAANAGVRE